MSRTVKELQTLEPSHLRFYSCGPTVYSYAHIGNFRSFLTADLIVRTAPRADFAQPPARLATTIADGEFRTKG